MNVHIATITPVLQNLLCFFPDVISFQLHFYVGRSQIEQNLKVKSEIPVVTATCVMINNHSNIEI